MPAEVSGAAVWSRDMSDPVDLGRRAVRPLLLAAAVATVVTALCIALLDAPVARYLAQWQPWPVWDPLLKGFETLGGLTLPKRYLFLGSVTFDVTRWAVALVLGAAALAASVTPRWRSAARSLWFLAAVHLISRLAMVELKEATERLRPIDWLARGGPTFFVDGGLSFPSGHVTYFLGLVLPVVLLLPRWGRWLLLIPAAVAACRVGVNAHFLSDVSGAVVLVCLIAAAALWADGLVGRRRSDEASR